MLEEEVTTPVNPNGTKSDSSAAGSRGRKAFALPISVAPSKGVLLVNDKMCAGCSTCVFTCTLYNDGVAAPDIARIQVDNKRYEEWDNTAKPCLQCSDPQCMRYCPTNAIYVDGKTGARVIDEKRCIGCQECIKNCPYDPPRIRYDEVKNKATKCNLCNGDPQCVKMCPFGALTYYTDLNGVNSGYMGVI
ncbi:4Fe-4S dicluster domain-containing protein [Chloroflexota bacterium]